MTKKIGINIVIETEEQDKKTIFIASSPDINVVAEGKTIDEVREKFIEGIKAHLETFPEERKLLIKEEKEEFNMPFLTRVFL